MKLCILAAGLCSRMGYLSENIPKGLLPLGDRPIISYIIEKVDSSVPIVVAVGYKAHLITQFCTAAYPDRQFQFVHIHDYSSPQSGPGYSLLQCKPFLQEPFYLSTSDDIVTNSLPSLDCNWIGVEFTDLPTLYSTAKLDDNNNVVAFINKDRNGYDNAFIGLAGIKDYEIYWKELERVCPTNKEFVDAWINTKIYPTLKGRKFDWYNMGIVDNYIQVKKRFDELGMPKTTGDYTYHVDNRIIKIFQNHQHASDRVVRSQYLSNVPSTTQHSPHVISYEYIQGQTLYESTLDVRKEFIDWCFSHLWQPTDQQITKTKIIDFYQQKTFQRVKDFLNKKPAHYTKPKTINGIATPSIYELLHKINWEAIHTIKPTFFWHGDLQFENVINNHRIFYLIDWRDSFAGDLIGDIYYDLGKLYGGLTLPYYLLRNTDNFSISIEENVGQFVLPSNSNKELIKHLQDRVEQHGFDMPKIKLMAALIQLNMCPLHQYPLDDFLFLYSIFKLNTLL